jgi:hypothetical protein
MTNEKGVTVYGTDAWPSEREHYEEGIGAFPCAERFGIKCVGCSDPSEKVQQRNRKYYFNAIDSKGKLRVFKIGTNLYKTFKAREQRMGGGEKQPLSDRDYIINRMGKGLETTYDPEPGEKYEVDFPKQLHDIPQILTDRYESATVAYNGGEPVAAKAKVEDEPAAKAEPKAEPKVEKAAEPVHEETPPSENPEEWGKNPTDEQIDEADTGVIKKWLDSMGVEYPARAPRSRIVNTAKDKAKEPPF